MKGTRWLVVGWVALVLGAAGCKEHEVATAACRGKVRNSRKCNSCCRSNGASGSKWVQGVCGCLGG